MTTTTPQPMDAAAAQREALRLWGPDGGIATSQDPLRGTVYHVGLRKLLPGWEGAHEWHLDLRQAGGCGLSWEDAFLDARCALKAKLERSKRREPGRGFRPRRKGLRLVRGGQS